jgi:hypothetical protein
MYTLKFTVLSRLYCAEKSINESCCYWQRACGRGCFDRPAKTRARCLGHNFDIGKVPEVNQVHTRAPREWSADEYQDLHSQIKSQFGFAFPPPKTFFGQGLRKHQAGPNAKPFISEFYGGLSRHWSASVFPFVEKDFEGWPIGLSEMHPYYTEVADEIGISGRHDELNLYFGEDFVNRPPIDIPSPIARLNDHINSQADQKGEYDIISGLNRLAVETRTAENSCVYCGECMYGVSEARSMMRPRR